MGTALSLGTCSGLNARISNRQCAINQTNPLLPCRKCKGLSEIQVITFQASSAPAKVKDSNKKSQNTKQQSVIVLSDQKPAAGGGDKRQAKRDNSASTRKVPVRPCGKNDDISLTSTTGGSRSVPSVIPSATTAGGQPHRPRASIISSTTQEASAARLSPEELPVPEQLNKKKTKTVKHPFTPKMNDAIRETYRTATGKSQVADLANMFGYPRWAVSKQARNIGAYEMKVKEPNWGEGDLKVLEESAHKSPERIQIELKKAGYARSIAGIILKRKRLNLLSNLDGLSATTVAGHFGVDIKCITGWIDKGWLKAEKRGTNRTEKQGGDQWYILKADVKQFIAEYIGVIDIRKVDKFWLRDIMLKENTEEACCQRSESPLDTDVHASLEKDHIRSPFAGDQTYPGAAETSPDQHMSQFDYVGRKLNKWYGPDHKSIEDANKADDSKTSPPRLSSEQVALFFNTLEAEISEVESTSNKTGILHLYRDRCLHYLYYAGNFSATEVLALNITSFEADPDHPEYGDFGSFLVKVKDSPENDPDYWLVPLHGLGSFAKKISWYATNVLPKFANVAKADHTALFFCGTRGRLQYSEFEARFQYYIQKAGLGGIGFTLDSLRRSYQDMLSGHYFDDILPPPAIKVIPMNSIDDTAVPPNPITLEFESERDRELYSKLAFRAGSSRRSIVNEIYVLLEESLAVGRLPAPGTLTLNCTASTPSVQAVDTVRSPPLTCGVQHLQLDIQHPDTQEKCLLQIVERFDTAIKLAEESPPRELRPLQRDKALFVIFHGCYLSAAELLKLNAEFQPGPLHPQVSEVLRWYVSEVRPYFMAKAAPDENALFLSARGNRLQLPAFTVRLQKANQLIGIDLKEFAPSMDTFRPAPAGGVVEVVPSTDAPPDIKTEEHNNYLYPSIIAGNRILSYLHDRAQHFAPSRQKGNAWLAEVGHKLMDALNTRQIPFKLVDRYHPVLTPNAGVFRIQGNKNVTVPIIESKVQEIYTTEGMRIINVAPEPGCLRLTVARPHRETLHTETALRDFFIQHPGAAAEEKLLVGIREEDGQPLVLNPYEQPHSLLAGSTGSGKSILLQNIILSIAISRSPEESKIFLIDPKHGVDYEQLERLPHIRMGSEGTISDPDAAIDLFEQAVEEMERRYKLFRKAGHGVNNIQSYRRITGKPLPTWWLIHDEFADWMQTKKYRDNIPQLVNRLSGKARAVGIFMVFAASRPDHTVLPNLMRDQMGNRLILKVQSAGTSEIALGEKGAEKLLGKGHMLAKLGGSSEAVFAQVPFIDHVHGIPQLVDEICAYYSDNDDALGTASASRKKRSRKVAEKAREEPLIVPPKRKYRRRQLPSPSECIIE